MAGLRTGACWLLLGVLSAAYFLATGLLAANKPLWFDELLTLHVARLPTLSSIWTALRSGIELTPPLYYLAARAALAVVADDRIAPRLPAALGFWVMSLSLFAVVRRRCTPACAWFALLFPITTSAFAFAYEARAYGLVLGCCGLALLCWQAATEGRRRRLALLGLTLSLAAAVASHYYAVLVFLPFGLGELVRSVSRKKVDLPVWVALGLAPAPLVVCLPLIRASTRHTHSFWSPGRWPMVPGFYVWLLGLSLFPLAAVVLWALLAPRWRQHPAAAGAVAEVTARGLPPHELVAMVALAGLPLLGVALAIFVTGGYTHRYVLPAVIGCTVLVAAALDRLGRARPFVIAAFGFVVLGWVLPQGIREGSETQESVTGIREVGELLGPAGAGDDRPVVVSDFTAYLVWAYYLPPPVAARLTCVSNSAIDLEAQRSLQPAAPLHLEDFATFAARHKQFLVLTRSGAAPDWLLSDLQARGARVEVKERGSQVTVLLIDLG